MTVGSVVGGGVGAGAERGAPLVGGPAGGTNDALASDGVHRPSTTVRIFVRFGFTGSDFREKLSWRGGPSMQRARRAHAIAVRDFSWRFANAIDRRRTGDGS